DVNAHLPRTPGLEPLLPASERVVQIDLRLHRHPPTPPLARRTSPRRARQGEAARPPEAFPSALADGLRDQRRAHRRLQLAHSRFELFHAPFHRPEGLLEGRKSVVEGKSGDLCGSWC